MNEQKFIINIGRQLGSGGRSLAALLAAHYGITAYDRKLIDLAALESGLNKQFFEQADEKVSFPFLRQLFGSHTAVSDASMEGNYLNNDRLFKIQSDVIRSLAERESCIFIGRCADYILRDNPRCVNLFVTANLDDRIQRICANRQLSVEQAGELVAQADRRRAAYYNFYTDRTWGAAATYHLCINSSVMGIESTAQYLINFIDRALAR